MKKKKFYNNGKQKAIFMVLSLVLTVVGCGTKNDVDENTIPEAQTVEYESGTTDGMTITDLPEETSDLTFAELSKLQFEFMSGAGGWSEGFTIEKDGSLRGNFHDSDMGSTGEGYPNGTMYCCSYTGQFADLHKINEYTYDMKLADISYENAVGTDEICDEIQYIYTESYCLGGNDTFKIYLPGTPLSELSEEEYFWISYQNESETELTMTIIVDEKNEYGIYSYQRPEPLEDANMIFDTYKNSYDYYENKCLEAETTVEMAVCTESMYKVSDDCLNYIWNLIKYNVDEDKFDAILSEQQEWIAQKEKQAEEITSEGGSMATVDCNRIMAELTMERCKELIAYLEVVVSEEQEENDAQPSDIETTVSGSFTVSVRDIIPDYCVDDVTPNVAVVTEFQSYPFTIFVGEEIGSQLAVGEVYVFTIKPMTVKYSKDYLESMSLSSLVWELPEFEITDFRLANEDELGLESLSLTIE